MSRQLHWKRKRSAGWRDVNGLSSVRGAVLTFIRENHPPGLAVGFEDKETTGDCNFGGLLKACKLKKTENEERQEEDVNMEIAVRLRKDSCYLDELSQILAASVLISYARA